MLWDVWGDTCTSLLKSTFPWPPRCTPGTTLTSRTTWDLPPSPVPGGCNSYKVPLKVSGAEALTGGGCPDVHQAAGFGQEPPYIAPLWTALVSPGLLQAGPTNASTLLPGPASPPDLDHKCLPLLEAALLHGVMFHRTGWLCQQKTQNLKSGFGHHAQQRPTWGNAEADANKLSCFALGRQEWGGRAEEGNAPPLAAELSS